MAMKYKRVRIPMIAFENIKKKQKMMEVSLKEITGKSRRIPLTKVIIAISQKPVYLFDTELKSMSNRRLFKI